MYPRCTLASKAPLSVHGICPGGAFQLSGAFEARVHLVHGGSMATVVFCENIIDTN